MDWSLSRLQCVAPFAGAWIEIFSRGTKKRTWSVAPFAGAWIEISIKWQKRADDLSHPSRVRGLKYFKIPTYLQDFKVAPFAGAWIEIFKLGLLIDTG